MAAAAASSPSIAQAFRLVARRHGVGVQGSAFHRERRERRIRPLRNADQGDQIVCPEKVQGVSEQHCLQRRLRRPTFPPTPRPPPCRRPRTQRRAFPGDHRPNASRPSSPRRGRPTPDGRIRTWVRRAAAPFAQGRSCWRPRDLGAPAVHRGRCGRQPRRHAICDHLSAAADQADPRWNR